MRTCTVMIMMLLVSFLPGFPERPGLTIESGGTALGQRWAPFEISLPCGLAMRLLLFVLCLLLGSRCPQMRWILEPPSDFYPKRKRMWIQLFTSYPAFVGKVPTTKWLAWTCRLQIGQPPGASSWQEHDLSPSPISLRGHLLSGIPSKQSKLQS